MYITMMQSPAYRQMTLDELLFSNSVPNLCIRKNETATRTYESKDTNVAKKLGIDIQALIVDLENFNDSTEFLRNVNREKLYNEFKIPKRSGGLRTIDAPTPALMDALRRLKTLFEVDFGALYHTAAYAYIKGRSTVKCMQKHQEAESRWYAKYDLHNFFGDTTLEFVMNMFSKIFPFALVCETDRGRTALRTALELAFLNGGLPQGTPVSPIITNVMMIPIDFHISKKLREMDHKFVYTRYADDFQVSSKFDFDFRKVENVIKETLDEFNSPFKLNTQKTRYGSSSGSNWNLGVMINKDNQMTVGYKAKRRFKAAISSYIMDKKNGVKWALPDVQSLMGMYSYYKMVEGETIDRIVQHLSQKFNANIIQELKKDIK